MKKCLSLVLVLALALGLMSVPAALAEEPITITIGVQALGNGFPADKKDDFVYQTILDRTGVAVEVVMIDDYYTGLNVRLAGGTAPDLFEVDADNMRIYAAQDLIKDLTECKEEIRPVLDYLGPEYDNYTLYVEDRLFALPRAAAVTNRYFALYLREDWLTSYGLAAPTTVDELFDFCMTLKEKDPVGGGQTLPFGGTGWRTLDIIANPYDVALGNYLIVRDGQVTNTLLQPGMKDALTMVKKFWDNGLIDPDIFVKSAAKEHMLAARVGAGSIEWSNILKASYIAQTAAVDPNAKWTWLDPLKNVDGSEGVYGIDDYTSNACNKYVVNADISDEKLAAIFKVLNYMATDEGIMLAYVGLEGEHWTYDESGKVAVDAERVSEVNYTHTYQLIGRNDPVYLEIKFPEAAEVIAHGQQIARFQIFTDTVVVPETYYIDDLKTYVDAQLLAFIKGDRPIEEYDAFVEELYSVYDFQTYMDLAAEQLVAMGLAEK